MPTTASASTGMTPRKRALKLSPPVRAFAISRSEGLEPPTYKFVACCSIQLSYDRVLHLVFGEGGIRTLDTLLQRMTV